MNTPEDVMRQLETDVSSCVFIAMLKLLLIHKDSRLNKKPEEISAMILDTLTKCAKEQRGMFMTAEAEYAARQGRRS